MPLNFLLRPSFLILPRSCATFGLTQFYKSCQFLALLQTQIAIIIIYIYKYRRVSMEQPRKKVKMDPSNSTQQPDFNRMYEKVLESSLTSQEHPYAPLLQALRSRKNPILQVITPQGQVYKTNPEKKKKPIELYLDTVNHLYKKRDLDILISPVTVYSVFQKWAPREVAIFEESILKFGKQFEFIAELIETKNAKEVYEFYLEWKSTSHYKSYKGFVTSNNRSGVEDYI